MQPSDVPLYCRRTHVEDIIRCQEITHQSPQEALNYLSDVVHNTFPFLLLVRVQFQITVSIEAFWATTSPHFSQVRRHASTRDRSNIVSSFRVFPGTACLVHLCFGGMIPHQGNHHGSQRRQSSCRCLLPRKLKPIPTNTFHERVTLPSHRTHATAGHCT